MANYGELALSSLLKTIVVFGLLFAVTMPGTLPAWVYSTIMSLQMLFFLYARIGQITINYKAKSTGMLSPITLVLSWLGNLARLITLVVDLGFSNYRVIGFNMIYFVFNLTPFLQYLQYMNTSSPSGENKKTESTSVQSEDDQTDESVVTLRKNKATKDAVKEPEELVRTRKKTKRREE